MVTPKLVRYSQWLRDADKVPDTPSNTTRPPKGGVGGRTEKLLLLLLPISKSTGLSKTTQVSLQFLEVRTVPASSKLLQL
jgi:hypothetical protein